MDNLKDAKERKCPKCSELIKFEAVICKHCHSDLAEAHAAEKERLSQLVLEGKNLQAIADEFNVLPRAVKTILTLHFGVETLGKARAVLSGDEPQSATNQPAPEKKKKGKGCLYLILGAVGLIVLLAIYSRFDRQASQSSYDAKMEESQRIEDSTAAAKKAYLESLTPAQRDSVVKAEEAERLYQDKIANPLEYLKVKTWTWRAGGFGSIGIVDITFQNDGLSTAKDIYCTFEFLGESGTVLSTAETTFSIVVPAGGTKRVNDQNLGFINNQSKSARIEIVNAVFE